MCIDSLNVIVISDGWVLSVNELKDDKMRKCLLFFLHFHAHSVCFSHSFHFARASCIVYFVIVAFHCMYPTVMSHVSLSHTFVCYLFSWHSHHPPTTYKRNERNSPNKPWKCRRSSSIFCFVISIVYFRSPRHLAFCTHINTRVWMAKKTHTRTSATLLLLLLSSSTNNNTVAATVKAIATAMVKEASI